MKEKKRRYHIKIECGADSLKDLEAALRAIIRLINTEAEKYFKVKKVPYSSVSGCSSFGWIVELYHDPEMTHEKYFEYIRKEGNR